MDLYPVQQTPYEFEPKYPSFSYWVKAGVAFAIGAGLVSVASSVVWLWLISRAPALVALKALAR